MGNWQMDRAKGLMQCQNWAYSSVKPLFAYYIAQAKVVSKLWYNLRTNVEGRCEIHRKLNTEVIKINDEN